MTDLFTWRAERDRAVAAKALRLARHGQVRRLRRAYVRATAAALMAEVA